MPEILDSKFKEEFCDLKEGESYIVKINSMLLKYDEIKYICKKIRIKLFYYLIFIIFTLSFILIGYLTIIILLFSNYLYHLKHFKIMMIKIQKIYLK